MPPHNPEKSKFGRQLEVLKTAKVEAKRVQAEKKEVVGSWREVVELGLAAKKNGHTVKGFSEDDGKGHRGRNEGVEILSHDKNGNPVWFRFYENKGPQGSGRLGLMIGDGEDFTRVVRMEPDVSAVADLPSLVTIGEEESLEDWDEDKLEAHKVLVSAMEALIVNGVVPYNEAPEVK